MRSHLHAYARRIYATSFPYRYRTLSLLALSSSLHASYAISVRRASVLPAASFRFHLAMDTLAVRLTIPPVGFVGDFHSLVRAPCRAHQTKGRPSSHSPAFNYLQSPDSYSVNAFFSRLFRWRNFAAMLVSPVPSRTSVIGSGIAGTPCCPINPAV